MLRGHAYCLVDEATRAVLRISSEDMPLPDGCFVCSVLAEQLPQEVQEMSPTPTHFEIEAVFIGHGRSVFLADDPKSVRIEIRESTDGAAEARHAEILARRFDAMEPSGVLDAAIVGLVRLAGAEAVARAAVGATGPAPKPAARKTRKKVK